MKQYTQKQIEFISEQFHRGQKAIQTNNFGRAEKCFLDILKIDASILEAKNALAYIYTMSKNHAKASNQLKAILQFDNNNANAHHNLANSLNEQNLLDESVIHYQEAIKLNPNFIDSYIQCGLVMLKKKNYISAIDYLQQALSLDRFNPKALYSIGITYAENGEFAIAIEYLSNAVKFAPNNNEYHLCLAKALEGAEAFHEADIQYHHTCSKFPSYLDAFLAYGSLLVKNRYYDQALECYSRANELAPQNTDILDHIGNIYLSLANIEMAIYYFNSALKLEPFRISSLVGIEQAYQEAGKTDDAINVCHKIISIDKNQPIGFLLESRIKKSKPHDGLAEHLQTLLTQPKLEDEDKIDINFALGKIYDDHSNYEKAFMHYAEANALRNQKLDYDIKENEDRFSKLIEVFDADFFNQHQNLGVESNKPIFIVGMPRSATTLTEQIISSHPDVLAAGEVRFWGDTQKALPYVINSKSDYPYCVQDLLPAHVRKIADDYEKTLIKISGAQPSSMPKHFTDKMPQNFVNLGLIALVYPNAKIIHTQRDPIDTCLSIFFQSFNDSHSYAFDLKNLGTYYKQYQRLMAHWHKVLPGRIFDINYADTIADPEYWSRKLLSYIELKWSDACLTPHKLERSVKTASHWQVRQPIYKTSVQRWKNYEAYIQPLIEALSY